MGGRNRRRKYFINKDFQSRFILRFLIVCFIGVILAVALFNFIAYRKIDTMLCSMRIPAAACSGSFFLREALYSNIFALSVIIVMAAVTAKGISYKMTGPLDAFRYTVHRLIGGSLGSRVTLRQKDEFRDAAEGINRMAEVLDCRFSEIKNSVNLLSEALKKFEEAAEGEDRAVLKEKIIGHINELEDQLNAFKI